MATPIIEHISQALKNTVDGITVANGYNQDLTAVRVKRLQLNTMITNDGTVFVLQGPAEILEDANSWTILNWSQTYIFAALVIDDDDESDSVMTRINQVRSDLEKALLADQTVGGYAYDVQIAAPSIEIDEAFTAVRVFLKVFYRTQYNDPYTQA